MTADEPRNTSRFLHLLGRRYFFELAFIVAAKLVALTVIYFVLIAPQPRTDTSPAAVSARIIESSPNSPTP